MARAIFRKEFHYTSRKANVGWAAKPLEGADKNKPQTFPREFIDAAVAAGCAEAVPVKKTAKKP